MAAIKGIPGQDFGFDAANNTQVVPLNGLVTLLLIAGAECKVSVDDVDVVEIVGGDKTTKAGDQAMKGLSEWEMQQAVERITLRGRMAKSTLLHAKLPDGRDWIDPLKICVRPDNIGRQVNGRTTVGDTLAMDVYGKTMHETAVRIAQDQLNSRQRTMGGADYGAGTKEDWCGIFAWWCWEEASKLAGGSNPFGGIDHLKSPQKAINWAVTNPGFRVFNVVTTTHIGGYSKPLSATIPLLQPSEQTPVMPGDIMIERHPTTSFVDDKGVTQQRNFFTQWKHVAMVTSKITSATGTFTTIEGNQGSPSIQAYEHSMTDTVPQKVGDHASRFAFVSWVE